MTTVRITGPSTVVIATTVAGSTVALDRRTVAEIGARRTTTARVRDVGSTSVVTRPTTVRTGGGMGVQGAPGVTDGATFNVPAGETIHGGRVVRVRDGLAFHPDVDDDGHAAEVFGLAVNSASIGQTVQVRTRGQMTQNYWTWSPGYVYCGDDGQLTQTPAGTGWLLEVGRVVSATVVDIDIEIPVFRS